MEDQKRAEARNASMLSRGPRGAPFIKIDRGGPAREPDDDWAAIVVVIVIAIVIALLT